jgi:putative transposase
MARATASHIRAALTSLMSPQLIRARAARLGVVKRRRKVDVVALVYAIVLGGDRGSSRSVTSLRRAYEMATGTTLARSAFYDRFTEELATLMQQLTQHVFKLLAHSGTRMQRALAAFSKVLIADGSLVRLHDALQADYPSVWTNHTKASAKVHIVMNGATRTPEILRIVPGSRHDVTLMTVEPSCRGALFIFDLAYYQGKLFRRIIDHGGHFLCRVKKDANFRIVSAEQPGWIGRKHQEILSSMTGKTFEVEVDYVYRHIPERDWTPRHIPLRLIAVWNPEARAHRLYLTSASHTAIATHNAAALYAMRWEIELLFRELKGQLRIEHIPTGNKAAAEVLLYASLLALAVGRRLLDVFRPRATRGSVLPHERSSAVLRAVMPALLELLLGRPPVRRDIERRLAAVLLREAPDPNRGRLLLPARARLGILRHAALPC